MFVWSWCQLDTTWSKSISDGIELAMNWTKMTENVENFSVCLAHLKIVHHISSVWQIAVFGCDSKQWQCPNHPRTLWPCDLCFYKLPMPVSAPSLLCPPPPNLPPPQPPPQSFWVTSLHLSWQCGCHWGIAGVTRRAAMVLTHEECQLRFWWTQKGVNGLNTWGRGWLQWQQTQWDGCIIRKRATMVWVGFKGWQPQHVRWMPAIVLGDRRMVVAAMSGWEATTAMVGLGGQQRPWHMGGGQGQWWCACNGSMHVVSLFDMEVKENFVSVFWTKVGKCGLCLPAHAATPCPACKKRRSTIAMRSRAVVITMWMTLMPMRMRTECTMTRISAHAIRRSLSVSVRRRSSVDGVTMLLLLTCTTEHLWFMCANSRLHIVTHSSLTFACAKKHLHKITPPPPQDFQDWPPLNCPPHPCCSPCPVPHSRSYAGLTNNGEGCRDDGDGQDCMLQCVVFCGHWKMKLELYIGLYLWACFCNQKTMLCNCQNFPKGWANQCNLCHSLGVIHTDLFFSLLQLHWMPSGSKKWNFMNISVKLFKNGTCMHHCLLSCQETHCTVSVLSVGHCGLEWISARHSACPEVGRHMWAQWQGNVDFSRCQHHFHGSHHTTPQKSSFHKTANKCQQGQIADGSNGVVRTAPDDSLQN